MVLSCNNICKTFGSNVILDNCSFHIEDKEKAAIVGINGAGKTTLLKIIMGEMNKDSGDVIIASGKTLGYLSQHQELQGSLTIYEEMLRSKQEIISLESEIRELELKMKSVQGEALERMLKTYAGLTERFEQSNGFAYKSEVAGVIKGLGFSEEEFDKSVNTLSGGQKTRVSLGKLLLKNPDILLLDEPINHLDMQSISWLETYLMNYKGSIIIVAHDRYFLDRVVTKVVEIDRGKMTIYDGNYTAYSEKKAKLMGAMIKQYYNQQKEIKAQEEVIEKLRSFNREKSIRRAESREKLLNKIEVLEKPDTEVKQMKLMLEPNIISGKDVLGIKNLKKSFDEKVLFSDVNFEVKRGERVAIIGNNGTGKTTLLKIIRGMIESDRGEVILGSKVHVGYYDQEHQILNSENNIFDEIRNEYPDLDNTKIRNVLAAFLFTGDDVFKLIKDLSGGERGRVSLAKLMLSEANLLILDEPTNHLDIMSKEILENALQNYEGTLIYVSHDRYFINKTATRILELINHTFVNYVGNYDYYLNKREILRDTTGNESVSNSKKEETSKENWNLKKAEQAKIRKRQNDIRKIEEEIHRLETSVKEYDELLLHEEIYSDSEKLMKIYKSKEACSEKLTALYEEWEELL